MQRSDITLTDLLADELIADVALLLLTEGSATQKEIAATLGLDSGTASRRMADVERWGLVVRDRSHGPYRLADPEAIGDVLEALAEAAARIDQRRSDISRAHRDRVLAARRNGGGSR